MKIEISKNKAGDYFWHLKHRNGRILATSEAYSSLAKAKQTVTKFVEHASLNAIKVIIKAA